MNRTVVLGLCVLVFLTPGAVAWTLGEGVEIEQPPTTIVLGHDIEVATNAYFQGDVFYIAPFGFKFSFTTPHVWTLANWSAPLNVTFTGNATEDGSLAFYNFQGIYQVTGLQGYPSFLIPGPNFEIVIPTGTTNFTVRLASLSGASPIQLHMSAAWSPLNDTVFAVATLIDNFGNAWSSLGMTSTLLRPDGTVHSVISMTETVVTGVYNANHAVNVSEPDGAWTVTASFSNTVASYAVIKQAGPITEGSTLEIVFDLSAPFYGNLSVAGVLVMLAWLAAFLWTASRHWYFMALVSWLGVLQPIYVSGFGITFTGILSLWVMMLIFHVVLLWRDERKQGPRRAERA